MQNDESPHDPHPASPPSPVPAGEGIYFAGRSPAQSNCTGQRRADFPCAFSAFQFVRIREICVVSLRLRVFALKK
jgi:hypothetical protein